MNLEGAQCHTLLLLSLPLAFLSLRASVLCFFCARFSPPSLPVTFFPSFYSNYPVQSKVLAPFCVYCFTACVIVGTIIIISSGVIIAIIILIIVTSVPVYCLFPRLQFIAESLLCFDPSPRWPYLLSYLFVSRICFHFISWHAEERIFFLPPFSFLL